MIRRADETRGSATADRAASGGEPSPGRTNWTHPAVGKSRLNQLRTGAPGADDGIVSVAGIVLGVAGTTSARSPIFTTGIAGIAAGAVSFPGEVTSASRR